MGRVTGVDFVFLPARSFPVAAEFYGAESSKPGNLTLQIIEAEAIGLEFNLANAFFEDPDGNVLAFHHRYAPRAR